MSLVPGRTGAISIPCGDGTAAQAARVGAR